MAERNVLGRGRESEDDLDTTELGRLNGGRQDEPSQGPRCIVFRQLLLTVGLASVTAVGVFVGNPSKKHAASGQKELPKPLVSGDHSKKHVRSGQKACTSKLLKDLPRTLVGNMSSIEFGKCTIKIKHGGQAQHHIDFFLGQAGFMKYSYKVSHENGSELPAVLGGSDEVFVRREVDSWYPQMWETDWRRAEAEVPTHKSPIAKQSNPLVGIPLPRPPKVQAKAQADFKFWRKHFQASDSNWQDWCNKKLDDDINTNCCLGNGFGSQFQQDIYIFRNLFLDRALRGVPGVYVESGASHWRNGSNSLFFDKCLGWTGICLETEDAAGFLQSRSCAIHPSVSQWLHSTDITSIDFWSLAGESPKITTLRSKLPFDKISVMQIGHSQVSDDSIDEDHFLIANGYAKYAELVADGLFVRRSYGLPGQQSNQTSP